MTSQLGTSVPALSRVRDRNALFRALGDAVESGSGTSVLVVVGFDGMAEFLERRTGFEQQHLLGGFAETLLAAIGDESAVYQSRRGEFCIVFEGGLQAIRPQLILLPCELDQIGRPHGIRASLGVAILPDEATVPTYALALADRRLQALSGNLRVDAR
jgi:GGDEF domain-containing protein